MAGDIARARRVRREPAATCPGGRAGPGAQREGDRRARCEVRRGSIGRKLAVRPGREAGARGGARRGFERLARGGRHACRVEGNDGRLGPLVARHAASGRSSAAAAASERDGRCGPPGLSAAIRAAIAGARADRAPPPARREVRRGWGSSRGPASDRGRQRERDVREHRAARDRATSGGSLAGRGSMNIADTGTGRRRAGVGVLALFGHVRKAGLQRRRGARGRLAVGAAGRGWVATFCERM